jgi:hypothetical protein
MSNKLKISEKKLTKYWTCFHVVGIKQSSSEINMSFKIYHFWIFHLLCVHGLLHGWLLWWYVLIDQKIVTGIFYGIRCFVVYWCFQIGSKKDNLWEFSIEHKKYHFPLAEYLLNNNGPDICLSPIDERVTGSHLLLCSININNNEAWSFKHVKKVF